jgi:hypothetical protein
MDGPQYSLGRGGRNRGVLECRVQGEWDSLEEGERWRIVFPSYTTKTNRCSPI